VDISVKPSEVANFAAQLNQWAQQMKATRQNIMARTQMLESQWKDPQYMMFVETAKNHATSLGASIEQFEVMSRELAQMSRHLEETQRVMQQHIRNMQR
jgi:uncharacterized protein YukE